MPIEIKELYIKVAVSPPIATDKPAAAGAGKPSSPCAESADREQIVADCVEQILQILKEKMER
jgi:hypothetical protein